MKQLAFSPYCSSSVRQFGPTVFIEIVHQIHAAGNPGRAAGMELRSIEDFKMLHHISGYAAGKRTHSFQENAKQTLSFP
jgi:hypothetical protein